MEIELKHTWRVSKAAWYIRLYLWVWDAREADITFCKLWWAYVFMWLGLPLKCFVVTLAAIGRAISIGAGAAARGARFIGTHTKQRWLKLWVIVPGWGWVQAKSAEEIPEEIPWTGENPPVQVGYPDWVKMDMFDQDPLDQPYPPRKHRAYDKALGPFVLDQQEQRRQYTFRRYVPAIRLKPQRISVMQRFLHMIEIGAAWSGMQRQRVGYAIAPVTRWVFLPVKLFMRGVWLLGRSTWRLVPLALKGLGFAVQMLAVCVVLVFMGIGATGKFLGRRVIGPICLAVLVAVWLTGEVIIKNVLPFVGKHLLLPPARLTFRTLEVVAPPVATLLVETSHTVTSLVLRPLGNVTLALLWLMLWPMRKVFTLIGRLGIPARILFYGLGGLYIGGLLTAIVATVVENGHGIHLWMVPAALGVMIGIVGIGLLMAWVMAFGIERWLAPNLYNYAAQPLWRGVETGGEITKLGVVGFGKIMLIGFKAVKSNTCPKVEVEE